MDGGDEQCLCLPDIMTSPDKKESWVRMPTVKVDVL